MEYGVFKSLQEAEAARHEIEKLVPQDAEKALFIDVEASEKIKRLKRKYGITSRTRSTGSFTFSGIPGIGILVITSQEFKMVTFEIKAGQTDYKAVIEVNRLDDVIKPGELRETILPPSGGTGSTRDGNEYFMINLVRPLGYAKESARLILQPFVVDCQTEDTVHYFTPLVYEGGRYHSLQDKRMGFDYYANDPLSSGYKANAPLVEGAPIVIDTVLVYHKDEANRKRLYKCPYVFVLEDYHHVYDTDGYSGSCLREQPFKFLDYSVAQADMPLTDEFMEPAEAQFGNQDRNLELLFEVGDDILRKDSINNIVLQKMIDELQSYGDKLLSVSVVGAASPDGSLSFNKNLAAKRARKAQDLIYQGLGSRSNVRMSTEVKVFTWEDVVAELSRKGLTTEAETVRGLIGSDSDGGVGKNISVLPFYEKDIKPILESQRMMKCSYVYFRKYIMNAEEAVESYYDYKKEYLNGTRTLSNGDYYNLFNLITDSAELDTITVLAYEHITKSPDYQYDKIAPYVANRMALLNLRRGVADTKVLAPFIDNSLNYIDYNKYVNDLLDVKVNRREILVNQAVTYFQEEEIDSAMMLINKLEKVDPANASIWKMKKFMDLQKYHYKRDRTAEEQQLYDEARAFVLRSNENKAILYTEVKDWDADRAKAPYWVELMDDADPRKWYLKALLWAEKVERKKNWDFDDSDVDPDIDVTGLEDIPYYLAYFQHSFDLQPEYKRYYINEGHVSEELRKKYSYRKKDIPAYRRLFTILKARDDRQREALVGEVGTTEDNVETVD